MRVFTHGHSFVIPRRPTESERTLPFVVLLVGGLIFSAAMLRWVPDAAANSLWILGAFMQCFGGLLIMLNPSPSDERRPRRICGK